MLIDIKIILRTLGCLSLISFQQIIGNLFRNNSMLLKDLQASFHRMSGALLLVNKTDWFEPSICIWKVTKVDLSCNTKVAVFVKCVNKYEKLLTKSSIFPFHSVANTSNLSVLISLTVIMKALKAIC